LATLDHKGEPVADVLKRADMALYQAKHDGRNRVVSTAA
jgi:two-component system, cell cycle response regulator